MTNKDVEEDDEEVIMIATVVVERLVGLLVEVLVFRRIVCQIM